MNDFFIKTLVSAGFTLVGVVISLVIYIFIKENKEINEKIKNEKDNQEERDKLKDQEIKRVRENISEYIKHIEEKNGNVMSFIQNTLANERQQMFTFFDKYDTSIKDLTKNVNEMNVQLSQRMARLEAIVGIKESKGGN